MLLMLIFQISPCSPCLLVPINKGNKEDKTRPNHKCTTSNSLPRGPQKKPERTFPTTTGLCRTEATLQVPQNHLPSQSSRFAAAPEYIFWTVAERQQRDPSAHSGVTSSVAGTQPPLAWEEAFAKLHNILGHRSRALN